MRHGPAVTGSIFELGTKPRRIDQEFLGHAAADDAGTAEPIFLGHHDAGAVLGGNARRTHAARSAANDEKIDVVFRHVRDRGRAFSSRRAFLLMTSVEKSSAQVPAMVMLSSSAFGSSSMTFWPSGDW